LHILGEGEKEGGRGEDLNRKKAGGVGNRSGDRKGTRGAATVQRKQSPRSIDGGEQGTLLPRVWERDDNGRQQEGTGDTGGDGD